MHTHLTDVIMDLELRFLIKLNDHAAYVTMGDLVEAICVETRAEGHQTTRQQVVEAVRKTLIKRYDCGFFTRWRLGEKTRISSLL